MEENAIENEIDNKLIDEKVQKQNEEIEIEIENKNVNDEPMNVYDLGRWNNINNKLRDLLVEKVPIRDSEINFPKTKILGISPPLTILENYQIEKDMIENGWFIQIILIEYIAFVVNCLISILKTIN